MKYKIDHGLYDNIEFTTEEHAVRTAEALALFLVRNTDRSNAQVQVLKFFKDEGDEDPRWYFHREVECRITFREQDT